MKVKLKKSGKVVAELEVLDGGALAITIGGQRLELAVRDARRLAGAIVERSVNDTIATTRDRMKRTLREEVDKLFEDE